MVRLEGVITAMATPFDENGDVDTDAAGASPPTCSSTARTASSSAGRPASARP